LYSLIQNGEDKKPKAESYTLPCDSKSLSFQQRLLENNQQTIILISRI